MKKKELTRRNVYVKPECNVLNTYAETILVNASGNAGIINAGEGAGDAKKTFLWDDDDASNINHNWSE